ncbi:hypothetical protein ACF0H5_024143 [Mactra antiquata]
MPVLDSLEIIGQNRRTCSDRNTKNSDHTDIKADNRNLCIVNLSNKDDAILDANVKQVKQSENMFEIVKLPDKHVSCRNRHEPNAQSVLHVESNNDSMNFESEVNLLPELDCRGKSISSDSRVAYKNIGAELWGLGNKKLSLNSVNSSNVHTCLHGAVKTGHLIQAGSQINNKLIEKREEKYGTQSRTGHLIQTGSRNNKVKSIKSDEKIGTQSINDRNGKQSTKKVVPNGEIIKSCNCDVKSSNMISNNSNSALCFNADVSDIDGENSLTLSTDDFQQAYKDCFKNVYNLQDIDDYTVDDNIESMVTMETVEENTKNSLHVDNFFSNYSEMLRCPSSESVDSVVSVTAVLTPTCSSHCILSDFSTKKSESNDHCKLGNIPRLGFPINNESQLYSANLKLEPFLCTSPSSVSINQSKLGSSPSSVSINQSKLGSNPNLVSINQSNLITSPSSIPLNQSKSRRSHSLVFVDQSKVLNCLDIDDTELSNDASKCDLDSKNRLPSSCDYKNRSLSDTDSRNWSPPDSDFSKREFVIKTLGNVDANKDDNHLDDLTTDLKSRSEFIMYDSVDNESVLREDYQWNETLKSFIMENLNNEPKEGENIEKDTTSVEVLIEQKLAEQYLNRNIENLKRKNSFDL